MAPASLSRAGHPPSAACETGFLRRAPLLLEHRRPSRAGDGPRADRAGRRADLPKTGDASMAVEVCVVAAARRSRISLPAAQSRPGPHPCTMRPPLSPGRGGAARARHAGGGARARRASGGDRVRHATFRLGPDLTPRHARRGQRRGGAASLSAGRRAMALGLWGGRIRTPGGPSRSTCNPSGSGGRRGATLFPLAPAGHRCGAFYGKSLLDPDGVAGCSSRCGWSYAPTTAPSRAMRPQHVCEPLLLMCTSLHYLLPSLPGATPATRSCSYLMETNSTRDTHPCMQRTPTHAASLR
jgi:hypothetical protein